MGMPTSSSDPPDRDLGGLFDPDLLARAEQEADERVRRMMEEANRLGPQRFLELCEQRRLLAEAEESAVGYRHLTIVHGDLESPEDVERFNTLHEVFWNHPAGSNRRTQGGNDYSTFVVGPPDADQVIEAVATLAHQLDPGWWQITPSTH